MIYVFTDLSTDLQRVVVVHAVSTDDAWRKFAKRFYPHIDSDSIDIDDIRDALDNVVIQSPDNSIIEELR